MKNTTDLLDENTASDELTRQLNINQSMNTDTAKQKASDLAKDILCSIIERSDRDKSFLTSSSFDDSVRDITNLIIKAEELTKANQKIQKLEKDRVRMDLLEAICQSDGEDTVIVRKAGAMFIKPYKLRATIDSLTT